MLPALYSLKHLYVLGKWFACREELCFQFCLESLQEREREIEYGGGVEREREREMKINTKVALGIGL
jgi:hypothetical protein